MMMSKDDCESSIHRSSSDDSPTDAFFSPRSRCCYLPCFRSRRDVPTARLGSASSTPSSLWERVRVAESEGKWWSKPFSAVKKLREWSEIVAGPKWKTFIRRFNRGSGGGGHRHANGNFQYDPLSYALNFDEGPAQLKESDEDYNYYPDFTARYVSAKNSVDLGRAVPAAS